MSHEGSKQSLEAVKERLWRQLVDKVDDVLLPVAGALLCMLVVVQLFTAIPAVRNHLDAAAGRFVAVPPDVVPASVNSEEATLSLFAAPEGDHSQVKVQVDGQTVGSMASSHLQVTVREKSVVTIVNAGTSIVFISVDHDNANLLTPAPGQTIEVDGGTTGQLPPAKFLH
jgi:hypothetical protein